MRNTQRPPPSRPAKARSERTTKPDKLIKADKTKKPTSSPVSRPYAPKLTGGRKELKYYGIAACTALWQRRPEDVIRIYIQPSLLQNFAALLKWAASRRLAYHLVEADDLERLTESVHHEGICVLAREAAEQPFTDLCANLKQQTRAALLYLDGVSNPHNLGAILRVAAHFGIEHILAPRTSARVSPSAARVAEGGAEFVRVVYLNRPEIELAKLQQQGFSLIAADAKEGQSLFATPLPKRSILVVGGEEQGLSPWIRSLSDKIISISGSGCVDSLNVATASAVLSAEYWRQHPPTPSK
jgi:TrmH RNA methyltransferase